MSEVRIALNAKALADAEAIATHLRREAGQSIEKRFARDLAKLFGLLASNPRMGRKTSRPMIHVVLMPRFPYHVIYRQARADELLVLRICHAHRRPLTWL